MRPPSRLPEARSAASTQPRHLAVQEDTAVTCVDWQPSHAWTEDDPDFTGHLTITTQGTHDILAITVWDHPTDRAADRAVQRIGWHRAGPWHNDQHGRRTAPVTRDSQRPSTLGAPGSGAHTPTGPAQTPSK